MKVCVCEEVRTAEKEKKEQWRREKEREERERVGGWVERGERPLFVHVRKRAPI